MIVELARISVLPGREEEFLAAFPAAVAVIEQADGFEWLELGRGVEQQSVFALRVGWRSLADHVDGFRGSERFTAWRAVIGPFFAEPPVVEHFTDEFSRPPGP